MNYEILEMPEKILVGFSAKTGNADPNMVQSIQNLWGDFFSKSVWSKIKNIKSEYPICLYSDYSGTDGAASQFSYDLTLGYEVTTAENSELTTKIIPAGKYAKFSIVGDVKTAVGEAWAEIWSTQLDRSFTGDFEEYLDQNMDNAKINIYIALKK